MILAWVALIPAIGVIWLRAARRLHEQRFRALLHASLQIASRWEEVERSANDKTKALRIQGRFGGRLAWMEVGTQSVRLGLHLHDGEPLDIPRLLIPGVLQAREGWLEGVLIFPASGWFAPFDATAKERDGRLLEEFWVAATGLLGL